MDHMHGFHYTNDHLIPSSRPTHVFPSYQHIQATPASFPQHNTHSNYHTNPHVTSDPQRVSTAQFRLPSLAQTLGFTPDFQASAPRVPPLPSSWRLSVGDDKSSVLTHASGICPQPSLSSAGTPPVLAPIRMPLPAPISLPATSSPAYRAPLSGWNTSFDPFTAARPSLPSRQYEPAPSTSLLLEDICHLEPIEDGHSLMPSGSCESNESKSALRMCVDMAYSNCPASEFSAPVDSSPHSAPPLSHYSLSGSDSSSSVLPKKEPEDDFFCFSSLPTPAGEDVFGPAPLLGIYADVNMRELAVKEQAASLCVNPAEVMGYSSSEVTPELEEPPVVHSMLSTGNSTRLVSVPEAAADRQLSYTPDFTADFPDNALIKGDFPEEAISAIVSVLKSSVKQEVLDPLNGGLPTADSLNACQVAAPQPLYPHQLLGYPSNNVRAHHPSLAFGPGCSSTAFPGPRIPLADIQLQQIQQIQIPPFGTYAPFARPALQIAAAPQPPMSPVLNAHTGIELDELRRRAADFRMRNPGCELDRSFLQCFAGRLSDRGELLDEYKCYVIGCGQRNKRRDHILVHVGSHVEHRPWQCQTCGMRFLRKNECKRHESSHEGRKPFSCAICAPFQDRSFVRQDLLKRHMRVSHGVNDTSRSRKRQEVIKNENVEGWP